MKIILTGATGMAGSEVLKQALQGSAIEQITVLTRRPTSQRDPKVKEILIENFLDYPSTLGGAIQDHEACIWCLGVSQNDVDREQYIAITYDYALYGARFLLAANPHLRFCFLSGQGADQTEKTPTLFGRIKGRTEKDLSKLSAEVYHFRPGYIQPSTPRTQPRAVEKIFSYLTPVINAVTDNFSVSSEQLARCLTGVAKAGAPVKMLDNRAIRRWQPGFPSP